MEQKKMTPQEERSIREEIRRELESIENKKDNNRNEEDDNTHTFEYELEKKRIRNEEIEKFYLEKGYKKYINHYGVIEWLTPEKYEKRMERKKKARGKKGKSKKKKNITIFVLMGIIITLVLVLVLLFVKYTFAGK
ncbi:hypothetical protein J7L48_03330 [bacterium]|nr:hypothetical protein [bacterium]